MSSADPDLTRIKEELKSALERRGVINQLKSRIRSEIYHCLESNQSNPQTASIDASAPEENVIINELIREYLAFNGYTNTLSVFVPEARQSQKPQLERVFLQSELGLDTLDPASASASLPLLYSAVSKLRRSTSSMSASTPLVVASSADQTLMSNGSARANAELGLVNSQKLDDLDKPSPISFKNI